MRINRLDNINFGYDKKLNKKLVSKLEAHPDRDMAEPLLEINTCCNKTEESLKRLGKNYESNKILMDILSRYFNEAKVFLCAAADRMFPDLNYTQLEADEYNNQLDKIAQKTFEDEQYAVAFLDETNVDEYTWLRTIISDLNETVYDAQYFLGDNIKHDYEPMEYKTNPFNSGKNELTNVDLTQKYVPSKYSPKSLDEVVGLEKCRKDVKNFIIYPLLNPKEAEKREEEYGIDIPHFIVFHGPPGCGKTMLAEAIAAESGCDMYKIDLSSVESIYAGGTVINVVKAFNNVKEIAKKSGKPVIIFLDEMDSLLSKRTSNSEINPEAKNVVNTLLPIITSAKDNNIIIIGATNMYDTIDKAVKRRIDMNVYIGLPEQEEIKTLLKMHLDKFKMGKSLSEDEKSIEELSRKLLGYSPANIVNIIKSASKDCFLENKELKKEDILNAIETGTYEKVKEREYIPESMKKTTMGF